MECARRAVGGGSSTAGVALVTEYEHEASEGRRAGGARAFGVDVDEGTGEVMIRELGAFDGDASGSSIGAVFEARWSAREGDDERCAFVDADGFLTLARAEETYGEGGGANARGITFHALDKVHCGGGGLGMATCLDWRADGTLAVSAADGSFRVVREETSSVEVVDAIEGAHDLEMWAVAFDLARADVLYTGADDCAFKDTIVATGSYDDHVRLWDVRALKSPVSELNVGGGVWRCRWHPTRRALACAAMGGGAALVDANDNALRLDYTYAEHGSIVYGADWMRVNDEKEVLVTCSFYDKMVRCWSAPSAAES